MNRRARLGALATLILLTLETACSITATRPVQEMSYTVSALRAAKEVQADTLVPELYHKAREWYYKARKEYRLKNFYDAERFAQRSRRLAEKAEVDAILKGANRSSIYTSAPGDEGGADGGGDFEPPDRSFYFQEGQEAQQRQQQQPPPKK